MLWLTTFHCWLLFWYLCVFIYGDESGRTESDTLECCASAQRHHCLLQYHANSVRSVDFGCIATNVYPTFTVVTYDTSNIREYSLYSLAIVAVFAKSMQHELFVTTGESGFNYEPRDPRWNKVKIMTTLIEGRLKCVNNAEQQYLVWMDSDLIFLDMAFDFRSLTESFPLADIIVSQDVDRLNGLVNTGCMVVRFGAWSLGFLREWWDAADRVDGMDQHVFDLVYNRRLQHEIATGRCNATSTNTSAAQAADCLRTKIAIVAPHVLNSHIPARVHQQPSHQFLHLAGESSALRAHIFKKGFDALCDAYSRAASAAVSGGSSGHPAWYAHLPHQLGLTREALSEVDALSILTAEVTRIVDAMHDCEGGKGKSGPSPPPEAGAELSPYQHAHCDLDRTVALRAQLRDAMQSRSAAARTSTEAPHTYDNLYALYLRGLRWAATAHRQLYLPVEREPLAALWVAPAQGYIDAALELCDASSTDTAMVGEALDGIAPVLARMLATVKKGAEGPVLYYQAKYLHFRADYYKHLHQPSLEQATITEALLVWVRLDALGHYGSGNKVADRYREVAALLARRAQLRCTNTADAEPGDESASRDSDDASVGRRRAGLADIERSLNHTALAWLPPMSAAFFGAPSVVTSPHQVMSVQAHLSLHQQQLQLQDVPVKVLHLLISGSYTALQCLSSVARTALSLESSRIVECLTSNDANRVTHYQTLVKLLCAMVVELGAPCVAQLLEDVMVVAVPVCQPRRCVGDAYMAGTPGTAPSDHSGRSAAGKVYKRLKRKVLKEL